MLVNNDWSKYTITDLTTLKGKRVILRLDLNLPYDKGQITDRTRLDEVIPFIKQLIFAGAKIIILSHFGEKGESIKPVADLVVKSLSGIKFVEGIDIENIRKEIDSLPLGDGVIIENTRMFVGEKDNTSSCARNLASLGDVFINDAFSASHRNHASIVGITDYILSYFGPTFIKEITNLSAASHPEKPALLIIGGAKISTKLNLIRNYLDQGVKVFVGGAMVHNIFKERGLEIGDSFYDPTYSAPASLYNHPLLITPTDVVLLDGKEVSVDKIPKGGVVVDCGKTTLKNLDEEIQKSKTIIVNGPLGLYEKGFYYGTEHMLTSVANVIGAKTYIGGGDTVLVAEKAHVLKKMSFVSLGGGAMLDYLANGTLPGINAVTKSK
ncbi:TPA: phosphoglycerate kinase [Candidatus Nomurabacteria bacterium]|nr:phosphoglycerate kinase [Candidatus Nomurabacteria bacterium]